MSPSAGAGRLLPAFIVAVGLLVLPSADAQLWDNVDGRLGSLAPDNLNADHPEPAFDLTGTWYISGEWRFLPMPTLMPEAQRLRDMAVQAASEGRAFNDVTGQCWPPGMPIVMTRVWPIHMIQLPTAVVMIFNFTNQIRWIYMDGRPHTDPDIYAPTWNGESIAWWEDDTLVIDTRNFETLHHYIDQSIPVSEEFRIIERIRLLEDGEMLEIGYTMTDPVNWEGEWISTKRYRRQHHVDFLEVHCLPQHLNEGILGTSPEYSTISGQ
jgi:hypothetical protein